MIVFSDYTLSKLRKDVCERISEKRFFHTLGVESAASYIADFCLPVCKSELRAAALLHDIAKEYSNEEIVSFIEKDGIALTHEDLSSPKVLHSYAAPYIIKRDFPEFASANILSACKNHTLGDPKMSVFDEIIFLSDFVEEGREYISCKTVREYLYSSLKSSLPTENLTVLHRAVLLSIEYTEASLSERFLNINSKMLLTKNAFISKI